MSKYIKLEDAIKTIERVQCVICGTTLFADIPTIEVSVEELRKKYKDFYEQGKFDALVEVSEDCISREYILSQAFASDEYNRETKSFDLPVVSVRDIEDAPSVAPTTEQSSLVRCKDCKWLGVQNEPEGTCYYWCRNIGVGFAVDEWNYCCWGERKEE